MELLCYYSHYCVYNLPEVKCHGWRLFYGRHCGLINRNDMMELVQGLACAGACLLNGRLRVLKHDLCEGKLIWTLPGAF